MSVSTIKGISSVVTCILEKVKELVFKLDEGHSHL